MKTHFEILKEDYKEKRIDDDGIYDFFEGWIAYAKNANSYNLRRNFVVDFESEFPREVSTKEINRYLKTLKKRYMPLAQKIERGTAFIPQMNLWVFCLTFYNIIFNNL